MNVRIEPHQSLPDLRRAPVGLVLLGTHNQLLDLERKLIGVPVRPPRAVSQPFQPAVIVAVDELVAGLARDSELPADHRHLLAIQKPRYEFETLVHKVALLPRHLCSPRKGWKCNPCLRNELSPISREG